MRATTEFKRIGVAVGSFAGAGLCPHGDDADFVTVFLAKERLSAEGACVIGGHDPGFNCTVLTDQRVHVAFDLFQFFQRHCLVVAKVEAQAIRRIERAFLRDVIAKDAAQCLVQQMRGRVVGLDRRAAL